MSKLKIILFTLFLAFASDNLNSAIKNYDSFHIKVKDKNKYLTVENTYGSIGLTGFWNTPQVVHPETGNRAGAPFFFKSFVSFSDVPTAGSRWIIRTSTGNDIRDGEPGNFVLQNAASGGFLAIDAQGRDRCHWNWADKYFFCLIPTGGNRLSDPKLGDTACTFSTTANGNSLVINLFATNERGATQAIYMEAINALATGDKTDFELTDILPSPAVSVTKKANEKGLIARGFKMLPTKAIKGFAFIDKNNARHIFALCSTPEEGFSGVLNKLSTDGKKFVPVSNSSPGVGSFYGQGNVPMWFRLTDLDMHADGRIIGMGGANLPFSHIPVQTSLETLELNGTIDLENRFDFLKQNSLYKCYVTGGSPYKAIRHDNGQQDDAKFQIAYSKDLMMHPSMACAAGDTKTFSSPGPLSIVGGANRNNVSFVISAGMESRLPVKNATAADVLASVNVSVKIADDGKSLTITTAEKYVQNTPKLKNPIKAIGYVPQSQDITCNYGGVIQAGVFVIDSANAQFLTDRIYQPGNNINPNPPRWLGWDGNFFAPSNDFRQGDVKFGSGDKLFATKLNHRENKMLMHDGKNWQELVTPVMTVCFDTDSAHNLYILGSKGTLHAYAEDGSWKEVPLNKEVLSSPASKFSIAGSGDQLKIVVISNSGEIALGTGSQAGLTLKNIKLTQAASGEDINIYGAIHADIASDGTVIIALKNDELDMNGQLWQGSLTRAMDDAFAKEDLTEPTVTMPVAKP